MSTDTEPSVTLDDNVYSADFEYRDTLRQTLDMLDSESSEEFTAGAVMMATELVGRDPVRFFGLIEVVQARSPRIGTGLRLYFTSRLLS
jgi:hypothetical protein